MSHRRPVSEGTLERSLRVITEEYVAQLLRHIRATEAIGFELIARERSEETDDSDLGEDSPSELVRR